MKIETKFLHNKDDFSDQVKPISGPIHLSTTFVRNEDGSFSNEYRYARLDNPNRRELEQILAQLEKGQTSCTFSSGMAAVSALFQTLKSDDHIIIPSDVFFNVEMLLNTVFKKFNISYSIVDMTDSDEVSKSINEKTRMIWIESPSNPMLKLSSISAISGIAKSNNLLLVVDNTWYTPVLFNPIDYGADIVMHSTTKYFGGHSDVMGGALIFKENNELAKQVKQIQILSGAIPSPFDCWLIMRGIKTMPLRVQQQSKTALQLAQFLNAHPKINEVFYPGLDSHPMHEKEKLSLKRGYGGMLSVLIGGNKEQTMIVINSLRLFKKATSLGGVESLVEHRQSVEGVKTMAPENLIRISVGLEHHADLINDWNEALQNIS